MVLELRSPIIHSQLANGLDVFLREDHAAPIASFWVFYRVGSRNERPGLTGISHWVEHMQFKGTPTIAKGQIFRDIARHGGTLNALTSQDWTAYFETVPSEHLGLAMAIEADRMTASLFDPAEVASERTVILSERQGAENQPAYLLAEEVLGAAFRSHPYRHTVIGHEADLRSISRDDLFLHYKAFYQPANAFVVAVGDFPADRLLREIETLFGSIPSSSAAAPGVAAEAPQRAERRVILRRPSPTAYLRLAFKVPEARHPDLAPLLVLDAILSGGKGMGLAGGEAMGRSSRLYRRLVSGGLARSVSSTMGMHIDPNLFSFGASAMPDVGPEHMEQAILDELGKLGDQAPSSAELDRAIKQVKAQYIYSAEGVTHQAFWIGQMEIVDSYHHSETLIEELKAVNPDDIRRVVDLYVRPDRMVSGWLQPTAAGGSEAPLSTKEASFAVWGLSGPDTGPSARPTFERSQLASEAVVLTQVRGDEPMVSGRLRVAEGGLGDPEGQEGTAALTARSLLRGTRYRSFEAINEFTDSLGASISVQAERHATEVSFSCLREDVEQIIQLAGEILIAPTFPADEVEQVRKELLVTVRESEHDTRATADRLLRAAIYPPPHPLGRRLSGDQQTVVGITRDDLIAWHAAHFGPNLLTVALVGGLAGHQQAVEIIERAFGGWNTTAVPLPDVPPPPPRDRLSRAATSIPGKSQADIAIGLPTISRLDPAYYALDTANLILGRLGLMGRLGATVRDQQGLAYYAFSGMLPGREGSLWVARAGVDPANVDRAIESIIAELDRIGSESVTAEELADAKSFSIGALPLALETSDGVARTLLAIEYFGLGLDYLARYPGIIERLSRESIRAAATLLKPAPVAIGIAGPPT